MISLSLRNAKHKMLLYYKLKVIPITEDGTLDMSVYADLLGDRTKVVFVNHVSNALGIINPIEEIIEKAHAVGAAVLIDGAQATPHIIPDVQGLIGWGLIQKTPRHY